MRTSEPPGAEAWARTTSGPRLWTAFAKVAPDLATATPCNSVSPMPNNQHQEVQTYTHPARTMRRGRTHSDDAHEHLATPMAMSMTGEIVHEIGLAGDAGLWGIDLVYKYDGGGAQGQGDFKFQTEYLRSIKDLEIRSSPHPEALGPPATFTTDGLYAQAVYGFAPRWTAGLRYDVFGLTNEVSGGAPTRTSAPRTAGPWM